MKFFLRLAPKLLVLLCLNQSTHIVYGFNLIPQSDTKAVVTGSTEDLQLQIDRLINNRDELKRKFSNSSAKVNFEKILETTKERLTEIKNQLAKHQTISQQKFLNKLSALLNELLHTMTSMQTMRQDVMQKINQQVSFLQEILLDPYAKKSELKLQSEYQLAVLKGQHKAIFELQEQLTQLRNERHDLRRDLSAQKERLAELERQQRVKTKEQSAFSDEAHASGWSKHQESQLLDLESELLQVKEQLTELKLKDLSYALDLVENKIHWLEAKLDVLQLNLKEINRKLIVSEQDLKLAEQDLAQRQTELMQQQDDLLQMISMGEQNVTKYKQQFEEYLQHQKINLPDRRALEEWDLELINGVAELDLYELAYRNEQLMAVQRELKLWEATLDLLRVRVRDAKIDASAVATWHQISRRNIRTEAAVRREREIYDEYRDEAHKDLELFKLRIDDATKALNSLTRTLENLKSIVSEIQKQQTEFINTHGANNYKKMLDLLAGLYGDQFVSAKDLINRQRSLINKMLETYASAITVTKDSLGKIDPVLTRLDNIGGILQRSEHAISWDSLKVLGPDFRLFIVDLKKVILSFDPVGHLQDTFTVLASNPMQIVWLVVVCLFILLIMLSLRVYLPVLEQRLASWVYLVDRKYWLAGICDLLVKFLIKHLISLTIWFSSAFLILSLNSDYTAIKLIFDLCSIPYWIYLSRSILDLFQELNQKYPQLFVSFVLQDRFLLALRFFSYATIFTFCLRAAFMEIMFESDLPKLFLAFYSIVLRAAIVFLIGREEVLSLMPRQGDIWKWIRDKVNSYYYPLLIGVIALMIFSDPYIGGYSKLVYFVLSGVVWTALLIGILWWSEGLVRNLSARLFFEISEDGSKERFANAKTAYGLFLVLLFASSLFIAFLILAQIWGQFNPLDKIGEYYTFSPFKITGGQGDIPVSLKLLVTILGFIGIGIGAAWIFNRYVLRPIFNLLVINSGVQNTILVISQYLIVFIVLFICLGSIGLETVVWHLFLVLGVALLWSVKDPANDFIAYFVLLIERSIKIGDYIELADGEIVGIVRKITPRTVVIRRKNSVSIIVPNSVIIRSAVYNWNYTQNFFAFDDFFITVPYSFDPKLVKQVILGVLDRDINILKTPAPVVRLHEFDPNGMIFLIRGFLSSVNLANQWNIVSDLKIELVSTLRAHGIPIAAHTRVMISPDAGNGGNDVTAGRKAKRKLASETITTYGSSNSSDIDNSDSGELE
ncbi:MAG TPA: mechanosensitive ion channel domain-containing protein [Candidatus Babeliales bacterium]|nr:mechanosensitive ion channel domain-containing protein [Candidatus Babeliales bacterium]